MFWYQVCDCCYLGNHYVCVAGVTGCNLLDIVLTNDYLLILTSDGVYVSNDMRDSESVNGVRMSPMKYARPFAPAELGCSSLQVSVNDNK